MKFVRSALAGLAMVSALSVASVPPSYAQDSDQVGGAVWVCYYDKDTYKLLYCRWE